MAGCAASCGSCGPDEVCYGGAIGSLISIGAVCLERCSVTGDCASGQRCVEDTSTYSQRAGRVMGELPSIRDRQLRGARRCK